MGQAQFEELPHEPNPLGKAFINHTLFLIVHLLQEKRKQLMKAAKSSDNREKVCLGARFNLKKFDSRTRAPS